MKLLAAVASFVASTLLILTAFSAANAAWRHRDKHRLNILALMTALAIRRFLPSGSRDVVWFTFSAAVFVAQPYILLRLVRHFRPVPRLLQHVAIVAIVVGAVAMTMNGRFGGGPVDIVIHTYLFVAMFYAAVAFTREIKQTSGVTSRRLVFAATGTWIFGFVFVVAVASPIVGSNWFAFFSAQLNSVLLAGILACYFLAFSTPRRLQSSWQRAEQARYLSLTANRDAEDRGARAASDLNAAAARSAGNAVTLVVLRTAEGSDFVVRASTEASLIGIVVPVGAALIGRACQTVTALSGATHECEAAIASRLKAFGPTVLVAPIASDAHVWGAVLVVQRHGSLFPEDDLQLLAQLARYAGTALDHANLVTEARERERRLADRRVREAESQMVLMLDSIKDYAMFVLDEQGRVVTWHIGAVHVFGYRSDEMLHEPAAPLYKMTTTEFQTLLSEARRFGLAEQEGPCRRRDGATFVGATVIRPLQGEAGTLRGFVAVTRDVTERRDLEERLRQSQKLEAIGQLAGGIAHDFNNLLTAILGYAEWLGRDFAGDSTRLQQVGEITKAAERAAALTRQLLAFSRRKMLEPSALNLSRLIADLLPMLHRVIGEHVQIVHEPAAEGSTVMGDRSQVEQVIVNLAVNARDAMPTGGTLKIRTVSVWLDEAAAGGEVTPGQYVMLEFTDTGTGIDAATQRRMFEPFFTTKEFGAGTGLGLATVYGIVKQMNGVIRVQTGVGSGTSFRLYFPETQAREMAAAAPPKPPKTPGGTETLLLVEDDEVVRVFLTKVLERNGYRVIGAERADVALGLARADAEPIHLVITDVVLPGGTGPELAQALRRIRPGLPILFISGYADAVLAQQGAFPKASHYLQKPFSAEELLQRIRQILGSDPFAKAGITS